MLVPQSADGSPVIGPDGRYICNDRIYPAQSDGRRITLAEYANAINAIFGGQVAPSAQYPGSYGTSITGFSTEAGMNEIGAEGVEQIELAAEDVAQSVATALPNLLPFATADDTCANTFLDTYIRRAFRHDLSSDERASLLRTFDGAVAAGASFSEAIALLTDHALQMPEFLYATEAAAPETRLLTGQEIASRLAFMFWDSIPDDALLAAADNGDLADPDKIAQQAVRLLADPKANTTISRFFREWTGTLQISPALKDPLTFPDFGDALAASMNSSFDLFVTDQLRNAGTLHTLLRSGNMFVDANLAAFFGVDAPADWEPVTLDDEKYSGLVTQPALLASLATPSDALYQKRGKFIVEQIMCHPLGNPPANAQSVFASLPLPANPTGKDKSAMVNAQPTCTGCHATLDPPGLAFESFDGLGQFRLAYASGKAIDPSGTMQASSGAINFSSAAAMMEQLAAEPEVPACFTKQIFRFALSREETNADACAIQALGDTLTAQHGNLAATLVAMTQTQSFRYRRDPQ